MKVRVHLTAVLEAHSMFTAVAHSLERPRSKGGSGAANLGDVSRVGLGANSGSIAFDSAGQRDLGAGTQRARKV